MSNWGSDTVEKIEPNGTRSTLLSGISAPVGVAVDATGAVYVASYSGDYIERVGPDGKRSRVVEGLATPTGIVFALNGRLLVANRASGEILSIDLSNGDRAVMANSLSLPVGVVEMPDGSVVTSQYGGRVTRILVNGAKQELGDSLTRPGVGILAADAESVLVIDNGDGIVRQVSFDGTSTVVVDGLKGSAVALGRHPDGTLLVGMWGSGLVYRATQ